MNAGKVGDRMLRGPYPKLGIQFDRVRTLLNDGLDNIWEDIKTLNNNANHLSEELNVIRGKSSEAKAQSQRAEEKADRVENELGKAVLEGDSSPLAGQLSVGSDGKEYPDAQQRFIEESVMYHSEIRKTKKTPTFTFILDDGWIGDKRAYEIFEEYGFMFSSAIPPFFYYENGAYGNQQNKDFQTYYDVVSKNGCILSHSSSHRDMRNRGVDRGLARYEITESKKILNRLGFDVNGYVSPFSETHEEYMPFVIENYNYAFTKYRNNITDELSKGFKGYHETKDDVNRLFRWSTTSNTLSEIKRVIDLAIENNGFLAFYDHNVGVDITEEKLRAILAYIKEKVDNGEALFLSCDKAVGYYFDVTMEQNKIIEPIEINMVPPFDRISTTGWSMVGNGSLTTSLREPVLVFSKSNTVAGEKFIAHYDVDIRKVHIETVNHSLSTFMTEPWILTGGLGVKYTLKISYNNDPQNTYSRSWEITGRRESLGVRAMPVRYKTATSVRVTIEIEALVDFPTLNVRVANPIFGFGNEVNQSNGYLLKVQKDNFYSGEGVLDNLTMDKGVWNYFRGSTISNESFNFDQVKRCLKIRRDGNYMLTLSAFFSIDNYTDLNFKSITTSCRINVDDTNAQKRYECFSQKSGVVSFNHSYLIRVNRDDEIYLKYFLDDGNLTYSKAKNAVVSLVEVVN